MTPKVFLIKFKHKIQSYYESIVSKILLLPKRYLTGLLIKIFDVLSRPTILLSKRSKPHILILRNSYYSSKGNQVSTEVFHLDHTLKSSNLATFEILSYNDMQISPISDFQFIRKCNQMKPDAIIFSSWSAGIANHPSEHAIKFVKKKMNIRTASLWWDTCSEKFGKSLITMMGLFDLHVIMDNPQNLFLDTNDRLWNRTINLWPPQDAELFHSQNGSRDIPVAFQGQVSSYRSYRREVLEHLQKNNIPGKFLTNDRNNQVTHQEYAATMRNSKISINFSQSVDCDQFKSRILEVILSGSLLMESENVQISSLFTPGVDYISFCSKEELVEKINYYLLNEEERKTIADQGLKTALAKYNSVKFWQLLLQKLEL